MTLKELRENYQYIIATLLVISMILSIVKELYFIDKKPKLILFVVNNKQIFDKKFIVKNADLKISYKEEPVENLSIVEMKIANKGEKVIDKNDWREKTLKIYFKNLRMVLASSIISAKPDSLPIKVIKRENFIEIEKFLLRPDEYFDILIAATSEDNSFIKIDKESIHSPIPEVSKVSIYEFTSFNIIWITLEDAVLGAGWGVVYFCVFLSIFLLIKKIHPINDKTDTVQNS